MGQRRQGTEWWQWVREVLCLGGHVKLGKVQVKSVEWGAGEKSCNKRGSYFLATLYKHTILVLVR